MKMLNTEACAGAVIVEQQPDSAVPPKAKKGDVDIVKAAFMVRLFVAGFWFDPRESATHQYVFSHLLWC